MILLIGMIMATGKTTKLPLDFPPGLAYYAYMMKENDMTAKKTPRSMLAKPRKVAVNPTPSATAVVYTENLVSLEDMVKLNHSEVLSELAEDVEYSLQARDETGDDALTPFGLYLGLADNKIFLPEIIVDEDGAYVLIFHDIR